MCVGTARTLSNSIQVLMYMRLISVPEAGHSTAVKKVGSVHSLSVLRSLVGGSCGSAVLPFAKTKSKVEIFSPEYRTVLFVLAEHILFYFNALGHGSQRRFASMGYHDTKHRALGAGDVLDSPAGTVGHRDI